MVRAACSPRWFSPCCPPRSPLLSLSISEQAGKWFERCWISTFAENQAVPTMLHRNSIGCGPCVRSPLHMFVRKSRSHHLLAFRKAERNAPPLREAKGADGWTPSKHCDSTHGAHTPRSRPQLRPAAEAGGAPSCTATSRVQRGAPAKLTNTTRQSDNTAPTPDTQRYDSRRKEQPARHNEARSAPSGAERIETQRNALQPSESKQRGKSKWGRARCDSRCNSRADSTRECFHSKLGGADSLRVFSIR